MAMAKKKKQLTYRNKPIYRAGDTVYYGNLSDKLILVLKVKESKANRDIQQSTRVELQLMDNTGELGKGQVFRKTERENMYKALNLGVWWLKDALESFAE